MADAQPQRPQQIRVFGGSAFTTEKFTYLALRPAQLRDIRLLPFLREISLEEWR
jgi:hypothetical protein